MECSAVIVAAGRGTRFANARNKILLPLGGRTVLEHSIAAFDGVARIAEIVVVVSPEDRSEIAGLLGRVDLAKPARIVDGGARRIDSVHAGVLATGHASSLVAIHDAARPLVRGETIARAIDAAARVGGAVVATAATDTVKHSHDRRLVDATIPRAEIFLAQTPQIFRRTAFLAALARAVPANEEFTDDAAVAEAAGIPVEVVPGEADNLKITYPDDLARAERILASRAGSPADPKIRVGCGFDVHRLVEGRRFVAGGVEIASDVGPLGHSDGDALLHALADAILGAAGLEDLGTLFPDTDPNYRDADSRDLLRRCVERAAAAGFRVVNADCVVVVEKPKLAPHRAAIRASVAGILGIEPERVNVKGKTAEGLGLLGEGRALAATCTVLLQCVDR
jgi:2-C-methyl-D-erythritol 4-phosphate cytidylyltransferase/2-C-methyl-D-erythritol 2,4-cyclodiphosphate synthase